VTGADVWQVRDLVNKSPGRNVHLPGAGVGGHCIPKDPWLLVHAARRAGISPLLLPAARRTNDRMPQHMADLVVAALGEFGRTIQQARVAVLGYAYLENSYDTRNTPSDPLCAYLRELGAEVHIHDPYIEEYCRPLAEVVANVDAIVVMVRHDAYRDLDLAVVRAQVRLPILIDGRRTFRPEAAQQAGFHFRSLGRG
jgi:nucleotide sugar dehydrogenase